VEDVWGICEKVSKPAHPRRTGGSPSRRVGSGTPSTAPPQSGSGLCSPYHYYSTTTDCDSRLPIYTTSSQLARALSQKPLPGPAALPVSCLPPRAPKKHIGPPLRHSSLAHAEPLSLTTVAAMDPRPSLTPPAKARPSTSSSSIGSSSKGPINSQQPGSMASSSRSTRGNTPTGSRPPTKATEGHRPTRPSSKDSLKQKILKKPEEAPKPNKAEEVRFPKACNKFQNGRLTSRPASKSFEK
jgi:hypothetical protein